MSIILSLLARRQLQPFWSAVHKLALGGMGYMNADSSRNGESWFLRWAFEKLRLEIGTTEALVFDVGANEGNFSDAVLGLGGVVKVHAFEPNPATFGRLQARLNSRAGVRLNQCGVSDKEEDLLLYDRRGSAGSTHASFLSDTFTDVYPSEVDAVKVRLTSLDGYVAEHGLDRIHFLKIDVEGFEKAVLAGARGLIGDGKIHIIQMEFNAHNLLTGLSTLEISKMLPGYDIFRIVANGLVPLVTASVKYNPRIEIFKYSNLAAIRRPD